MADDVMGKGGHTKADEYDREHGTYDGAIHEMPDDTRLTTGVMPKAPDPTPFKVGDQTPSSRSG